MRWLVIFVVLVGSSVPAFALDWTQPLRDELGEPIPDWADCPGKVPGKDKCDKIFTIGVLAARMLCIADPQRSGVVPEQKALECRLGLDIIKTPDLVPDAKQLSIVREAIGRHQSPLAVVRGWEILDAAVK